MLTLITTCSACSRHTACLKGHTTTICADCLLLGIMTLLTCPIKTKRATSDLATLLSSRHQHLVDTHLFQKQLP